MDVARVVVGAGQVDRASVYVPLTRGREGNYLYLTESMPGDTDTGHGGVALTQRREGAEYARDLLVAAAARDGADQIPHQVWGTARADWALTRLDASGEFINYSPFTGIRMGESMENRKQRRAERFSEFFRLTQTPSKKSALASEPDVSEKRATEVNASPQDEVKRYQQRACEYAAALEQARAQQA
ncbi:hypothetical protein FM102_11135 [Corynebacterium glutamicum]|uniref:hypothetical protein n=1 Tax=Corynebacterium glutamicum TaxID=1718 RepID=UPI000744C374|nr:hypothetical protein [Corynebacterium glutamicum]ALZ98872.1 hypothetical protein APT58_00700 [Corynebacterium glutamicum]SJM66049.1 hypothetical protein FM102_11135 [Corynebacterium glutamicum]